MVPIPKAKNINELNKKLLKQCFMNGRHKISGNNRTVNERFENEKNYLVKLPKIPFVINLEVKYMTLLNSALS